MLLQRVFPASRIKVGLDSEDKDELFEELVDVLAKAETADFPRRDVLLSIRERESKMSTGIKTGIAIPHGKTAAVEGLVGALGISRKGVDYQALDGEPVYLVFLLVSSSRESEIHLRALKRLARLLDEPKFYTDLVQATSPEHAFSIIQRYEEMISLQQ